MVPSRRDADGGRVAEKGERLCGHKGKGAENRAAEVLGGGFCPAQDPVRMGKCFRVDQLGHGGLGGRVVDRPRSAVYENEDYEQQVVDAACRNETAEGRDHERARHVGHRHDPSSLVAVGDGSCGQREHEPRERVSRGSSRHRQRARVDDVGK